MAVHHPGKGQAIGDLKHMVTQMVKAAMQNASYGSAGLRVHSGGFITIENGGLVVTGSANVSGQLGGNGTFDWTGPWFLKGAGTISGDTTGSGSLTWTGPWTLAGAGDITGNVDITGALDVRNRITLGPSGYIESGTVRIDRLGAYGGRVVSSGSVLLLDAVGTVRVDAPMFIAQGGVFAGSLSVNGDFDVLGTVSATVKLFKIPHPSKECHVLRHGATESPVSGVEYWGEETLDENGELTVTLPDYFESLTKQENRAILVTPRGFIADWGDIENGSFTVMGKPGGRFSWLVKAERHGADFPVEEAQPAMDSRTQYLSQDK